MISGPVTESKPEKVKYVDDGTVAVSINLKKCLIDDPEMRPKPLNFHERTQKIIYCSTTLMTLNHSLMKTK
jgi:hypothetical protein